MYYDSIPNSNKKIILIRKASGQDITTMTDEKANWRSLFKDVITSSNPDETNMLGLSSDSLGETTVNSNISLLMTDQLSDLGTNNKYNPVVKTINEKLGSLGGDPSIEDTERRKNIMGILGGVKDVVNTTLSVIDQIKGNYRDPSNGNFQSNRSIMPWFTNAEAWTNEEANVSFKYTFNFSMGQYGLWNAKEEVFLPILNLIAPTLIRNLSLTTTTGPYPTAASMVLKALEPDSTAVDVKWYDRPFAAIEQIILNAYEDFTYSISFGSFLKFNRVMITNSSYSFSRETDQFGYPIAGSVTLEFNSIVPMSLTSKTDSTMALRLGNF